MAMAGMAGVGHLAVCFQVEGYQQLEAWCDWLAAGGVEHTSITYLDQLDMSALVFCDPAAAAGPAGPELA